MRICFVGDSITNGTGDPEYLGWVGRVMQHERTRRTELTSYNLGIRRDRSDQIRARWRAEVDARLPDEHEGRVVFAFGANDAVQEIPPAVTLGHAEAMLTEALVRWPVIMVGTAPLAEDRALERVAALDEAFGALCGRLRVPYAPVFAGLMATPVWLDEARAGDGAHPGAGGYRRMADLILASDAWRVWMA
ncbi:MAG: GDSL family lipase [Enhydrobacter sp.]|nr:GDSL family lipase [Enhydrobacter sp.]